MKIIKYYLFIKRFKEEWTYSKKIINNILCKNNNSNNNNKKSSSNKYKFNKIMNKYNNNKMISNK